MNTTTLFIFFLLALLCVGLSITNYLNITILGNQNELIDFKGNRSNFLEVDGESTVITTFEQFGEPKYKSNALTIEDTPVKIQVLDSAGDTVNPPCINIVNTETDSTAINFRINDTTSGSKIINYIGSGAGQSFISGHSSLAFKDYDIFAPCLFNLAPYLSTLVGLKKLGYYNLSSNKSYMMDVYATAIDVNIWFSLPTPGYSGEYINFIFVGTNSFPIYKPHTAKMRWGPPGIIAPNSIIENYFSDQGIFTNKQQDPDNFGAFNTYDANNILACYCDSSRTLLGKNEGANTTVAGLIVKFSSVPTSKGYKWAVEIDNVYPMVEFQYNTDWSSGTGINV